MGEFKLSPVFSLVVRSCILAGYWGREGGGQLQER